MSSTHLLVLVHGMWGNPSERVRYRDGTRLDVLLANTNSEEHTYDGIDWGGERVAQEISRRVEDLEAKGAPVTRFSITGYSLGGLIARYVIGILHQQGFFEKISPVNFNTVATPHLGLLRYDSFWSTLSHSLGPRLLSRTGEQFYFVDKWSAKGRPLLEVMADPERVFYQALQSFRQIRIYGNAINDITVPYITACIELEDPFMEYTTNGLDVELDPKYAPLIKSWQLPAEPPLIYATLPLVVPLFLSLVLFRLGMSARKSRRRIKLLEADPSKLSNGETLMQAVAKLEKDMEDAVADMMENPSGEESDDTLAQADAVLTENDGKGKLKRCRSRQSNQPKSVARIAPLQRKMAAALNELPIQKERAFIENVRNSHAVIISRDVKNFDWHRQGEGVIRHWADSFEL
ncbi:putative serine esterase-domain-containing protein [Schizophyllum fasciatum]